MRSIASGIAFSPGLAAASIKHRPSTLTNPTVGLNLPRFRSKTADMGCGRARAGKGRQLVMAGLLVAISIATAALPNTAGAQFFDGTPMLRPPKDVPSVSPGPAQNIAPANPNTSSVGPK